MSDQSIDFARYHIRTAAQERRSAEESPSEMVRAIHTKLAWWHEKMQGKP